MTNLIFAKDDFKFFRLFDNNKIFLSDNSSNPSKNNIYGATLFSGRLKSSWKSFKSQKYGINTNLYFS